MSSLADAFRYAFDGVAFAWRCEPNFRIELAIGLAAIALGLYLGVGIAPLVICCALVLSLELINSALEAAIDLTNPGHHPLAKQVKDLGAGAVLLASAGSAVVGLVVLGPPLWQLLLG